MKITQEHEGKKTPIFKARHTWVKPTREERLMLESDIRKKYDIDIIHVLIHNKERKFKEPLRLEGTLYKKIFINSEDIDKKLDRLKKRITKLQSKK